MKTKLVVWDWNGTLLADTRVCIDAGNRVITAFGGEPLPNEEYVRRFSFPVLEFYASCGADRERMLSGNYSQVFHDFYKREAVNCRTRKGVRTTLDWLREHSIDSVILSNHLRAEIVDPLKRLGIEDYFEAVLAHQDTESTAIGNNKVGRIKEYLARGSYSPSEILIVGDSPEDVNIGKEVGAKTIGITRGYFSLDRLKASRPDYLINKVAYVPSKIC